MEQVAVGMFNYITELEPFNIDEACTQEIEVTGEHSLLPLRSILIPPRPRHGESFV